MLSGFSSAKTDFQGGAVGCGKAVSHHEKAFH